MQQTAIFVQHMRSCSAPETIRPRFSACCSPSLPSLGPIASRRRGRPTRLSGRNFGSLIVQQTRGSLAEPFKCKRQGALAHHRRLRGRAHDPQRPGVLECGGCEGRSAPSLYCWYVWIGSLIHLVIAPTSRSIPKLQHYPKMDLLQIGTSLNVASTLYHTWKGSVPMLSGRPNWPLMIL